MCGACVAVMDGELGRGAVVVGQDRARLERHARVAAAVEGGLDDLVRGREGVVDLAGLVDALEAEVVAELGMDHGRRRAASAVSMSTTAGSGS